MCYLAPYAPRPSTFLRDRLLASGVGLLQWLAAFIAVAALLTAVEFVKQAVGRYRRGARGG